MTREEFLRTPSRPEPRNVLLCTPEYFDVVDVKNIHMENQQGKISRELAQEQWQQLYSAYLGFRSTGGLEDVFTIQGVPELEDMVFCANQSFPWLDDRGNRIVVMSRMKHASREREVPWFEEWYRQRGYRILHLPDGCFFEGMGDCIPQPGRRLLWCGHGFRTDDSAYPHLASLLGVQTVPLSLYDPRFYHLDTCFIPVNDDTALLCRSAFAPESLSLLQSVFSNLVFIPEEEAETWFALNAHLIQDAVSGRKLALLQRGSPTMDDALRKLGFGVMHIPTSEFMKSGGSVFCMKMMVY